MSSWVDTTLGEVLIEVDDRNSDSGIDVVLSVTEGRGIIPQTDVFKKRIATDNTSNYKIVRPLDVAWNPYLLWTGAVGQWLGDSPGVTSPVYPVFRAKEGQEARYWGLVLGSGLLTPYFNSTAVGSIERRRRTTPAVFKSALVQVPSLAEQRRIVDVMAAIDTQIEALDNEVVCARVVLGSLRRELGDLGDKVPLASLAAEGGIQIGPFGSQLHAHEYTDNGVPVVMPQDLVDGQIVTAKIKRVPTSVADRLKRHRLTEGDVVFPRRGDLGKRALVTAEQDGWLCGTGCLRFRAADPSSAGRLIEAMAGAQTTEWLIEHAVGTTMLNLNTEILCKLPVADVSAHPELADAAISTIEPLRRTILERVTLRALRSILLTSLMNQGVEVPESYDALLAADLEVAS